MNKKNIYIKMRNNLILKKLKEFSGKLNVWQWITLLALLLGLISFQPIFNWVFLGYDLRIELKNDLRGNYSIIEISNEGGYPLHNLNGELKFLCEESWEHKVRGGKLEGYVDTLDKGDTKALLFKDDDLSRWMGQTEIQCADVIGEIKYFDTVDDNNVILSKLLVFEYFKDNDHLKVSELEQGEELYLYKCSRCSVDITINTSEKNFITNKKFVFAGVGQNFRFIGNPILKIHAIDGLNIMNYDKSCFFKNIPCYKRICTKLVEDYSIPIDCDSFPLMPGLSSMIGTSKIACQRINNELKCERLELIPF